MGTALTERQLKELQRLTRRLYLCFDSDAAGEEATLRGMELASSLGFDVRVVTLPKGQDPADAPDGFEKRLVGAESYVVYRVRLELDRTPDRQEAFVAGPRDPAAERGLAGVAGRAPAARRTPRPAEGDAGGADAEGRHADARRRSSRRRCSTTGERLERDALAACVAHPTLAAAAGRARPGALRVGDPPPVPRPAARTEATTVTSSACGRSSTHASRARESTSEPAGSCCSACGSGACGRTRRRSIPDAARGRGGDRTGSRGDRRAVRGTRLATLQSALPSRVAQLAEHPAVNRRVVGSSPTAGAHLGPDFGTLAFMSSVSVVPISMNSATVASSRCPPRRWALPKRRARRWRRGWCADHDRRRCASRSARLLLWS